MANFSAFISYRRLDKDYALQIKDALEAKGYSVFIDLEDLPPSEAYPPHIRKAIEESDNFLFLISPDSIVSNPCREELEHAARCGKYIIPVECRNTDPNSLNIPTHIRELNWIRWTQLGFDLILAQIVSSIQRDYAWKRRHSELTEAAIKWNGLQAKKNHVLLQNRDVIYQAIAELNANKNRFPKPSLLLYKFVEESKNYDAYKRRKRNLIILIIGCILALLTLVSGWFAISANQNLALANRREAARATSQAIAEQSRANAFSAVSNGQIARKEDPEIALLIGLEASKIIATDETRNAIHNALDAVKINKRLVDGHDSFLYDSELSPNNDYVATAGQDGIVRIWDIKTQLEVLRLIGHTGVIRRVTWSSDGNHIATASEDRSIRIWNSITGKELHRFLGHDSFVTALAWSPDNTQLASGSADNSIRVWDAKIGIELIKMVGHVNSINQVNWSPNGASIISASEDQKVINWDAKTGKQILIFNQHTLGVYAAKLSPNGVNLLTASQDQTLRVWNAKDGHILNSKEGLGQLFGASWSPDGKLVAAINNRGVLYVFDNDLSRNIYSKTVTLGGGPLVSISWAKDNQRILVTGMTDRIARIINIVAFTQENTFNGSVGLGSDISPDNSRGAVAFWDSSASIIDLSTGLQQYRLLGHKDSLRDIAWSPDGKKLVTTSRDRTLRIWDADTGNFIHELSGHEAPVNMARWSPNGKRIISASWDKTIRLWDSATGKQIAVVGNHPDVMHVAIWSPDGQMIATAGRDKYIRLWNIENHTKLAEWLAHDEEITSLSWSSNGNWLASASTDKTAKIWDIKTYKQSHKLTGHAGPINKIAFSADSNYLLTASDDNTIRIWDAQNEKEIDVLRGHTSSIYSAAWGPDGKQILSTSNDNDAILWGVFSNKKVVMMLNGHRGTVQSVDVASNNLKLVSGGRDNSVRIWNLTTANQERVMLGHTDRVVSVRWSPDDTQIASASFDRTLKIWDATTGALLNTCKPHIDELREVSWAPITKRIASSSLDKTIAILDPTSCVIQLRLIGHKAESNGIAWSQDEQFLFSSSQDGSIFKWDLTTGQIMNRKDLPNAESIIALALSPNGAQIAAVTLSGNVFILNAETLEIQLTFHAHHLRIYHVSWSKNSKYIATTGQDGTLKIWRSNTGELLSSKTVANVIYSTDWLQDNKRLAIAMYEGQIRLEFVFKEDLLDYAQTRVTRNLLCEERRIYLGEARGCPASPFIVTP